MEHRSVLKTAAVLLACTLIFGACHRSGRQPLSLVMIIDVTASTDADGRARAFQAVQKWFEQKRLRRGDKITVIPLTGDALTESQGRILRFALSEQREAYDGDLRRLGEEMQKSVEQMEGDAAERPYQSSDVLGAVKLGVEELQREGDERRKVLVVLSDFIQDDVHANFKTIPPLANRKSAEDYARKLAADEPQNFRGSLVYLGLLRSTELKGMAPARRDSLQAFWAEYFRRNGAQEVITVIDGPGQVDRIIQPGA